jgi:hypothetical protein
MTLANRGPCSFGIRSGPRARLGVRGQKKAEFQSGREPSGSELRLFWLQRAQEIKNLLLLCVSQTVECINRSTSLAGRNGTA